MRHRERINREWTTNPPPSESETVSHSLASLEVLMDIREELRRLNRLLACPNFTGIPATLRKIDRNTAPKRAPRKAKP